MNNIAFFFMIRNLLIKQVLKKHLTVFFAPNLVLKISMIQIEGLYKI